MAKRFQPRLTTKVVSASLLALGLTSCAVLKPNVIEPAGDAPAAPEPIVPGYAGVPHPPGLQVGDLIALFATAGAPKRESDEMKTCAADYAELEKRTKARDELKQGLLELVRKEPIRYHWCFYSKVLELEERLRKAQMLDERQRAVVEGYRFIAPLSRVFYREYHDSRYLRWAVSYYRRASELAFYRRVESAPSLTQELVGAGDDPTRGVSEKASSVLEKYGIIVPERLQPGQRPDEIPKGEALPSDAYVNTGSGAIDGLGKDALPAADAPAAVMTTTNAPISAPDRAPASAGGPSDAGAIDASSFDSTVFPATDTVAPGPKN